MMMLRWLGISIVVVILFAGWLWLGAASRSQAREIASQLQAQQPKKPVEPRKEYVLEVIGLITDCHREAETAKAHRG